MTAEIMILFAVALPVAVGLVALATYIMYLAFGRHEHEQEMKWQEYCEECEKKFGVRPDRISTYG